jgi:hypothetical protein
MFLPLAILFFIQAGAKPNGNIVPGKMYFSNTPFGATNTGSKESFASNEFIYGRMELEGSTIKEAFRIKEPSERQPYSHLIYESKVFKDGIEKRLGSNNNYILLNPEDLNSSFLNFDVMPDPGKSTTLFSMLDDFSAGYGYFPMYNMINEETFPQAGKYVIQIRIFYRSLNAWGKEEDNEKWPEMIDEFEFVFKESDVATLMKNQVASAEAANNNAFRYDKLPAVFSNPGKATDPKATIAKIAAILKRDLPHRTILKFVVEKYDGVLWHIAKDDYGLPKYRYFNPHVYVAYKQDGRCYVGNVTLRETYSGGGTYGPLQVGFTSASGSGGDRGIDCAKIK